MTQLSSSCSGSREIGAIGGPEPPTYMGFGIISIQKEAVVIGADLPVDPYPGRLSRRYQPAENHSNVVNVNSCEFAMWETRPK